MFQARLAAMLVVLLAAAAPAFAQQSVASGGIFGQQKKQPTKKLTDGQWRVAGSVEATPRQTNAVEQASHEQASHVEPGPVVRMKKPATNSSARPNSYFGAQPAAYRSSAKPSVMEPSVMEPVVEGEYLVDGEFAGDDFVASEGEMMFDGAPGGGDMMGYGARASWIDNLWLFGGSTGFKGPIDQGQNGNFGFHQGANYAVPLFYDRPLSAQVGVRFSQSNFSGSELSDDTRHQMFFTAGLFRRVQHGWQLGAAFDWLKDDFYAELDVHQIRGEVSWVSVCGNELGVMAAVSSADDVGEDGAATLNEFYEVADQFALFLRIPFNRGGNGRVFGGGTSDHDGLVGAELNVPINDRWSIQTAATYLIPEESSNATVDMPGHVGEIWGVSIALVWYPGCPVEGFNPFKPLFNVADNTSMLVERRGN